MLYSPRLEDNFAFISTKAFCCFHSPEFYNECTLIFLQHWSRWLPFFPTPDIRILDREDTGGKPLIVNFPFQSFPAKKHAVHPDIHYKLSSKARIPEMGAPCPRYMSRDNYTLPCMIKSTQGVGGRGVFLAQTKDEARAAFRELKSNFCCHEPVITEVIQDITEFLNVQIYLFQNGDFHWLGVRRKMYSKCLDLSTPDVNWEEQPELRKQALGVALPVMKYLHKNNYFGFIGVEILINNKGKFLIDVNLKTSDSTYLLLLAPRMAALKFPVCCVTDVQPTSIERLIEAIEKLNNEEQGRLVVLSGDEFFGEKQMKACVAVFAKNAEVAFILHRKLLNLCSSMIYVFYDENRNPNELIRNETMANGL